MSGNGVLQKLNRIDTRFNAFEADFRSFKDQVLTGQDETLTVLRRLDEERVFAAA